MLAGDHISVPLRSASPEQAERVCAFLTDIARRLHAAGHADKAKEILHGAAQSDKDPGEMLAAVEAICSGAVEVSAGGPSGTFGWLAERWTSGVLAREYPDYVKRIDHKTAKNISRLDTHILPTLRDVPLRLMTKEHARRVMSKIPAERGAATRRHVAQIMHILMRLAADPLDLIETNPLRDIPLPKLGDGKAKGYLYPDEDAKLLACLDVPLEWRLLYGFLHRECCRISEANGLDWPDFDLDRGGVRLDENKTNDPRQWAMVTGTTAAMRIVRVMRAPDKLATRVFLDEDGLPMEATQKHFAERFRGHLKKAKIDRAELYERSKARQPIRIHDTRATGITVYLALGKSESWIQDRSGHKSSVMINRYKRAARTMVELDLVMKEFLPLDQAIPELREATGPRLRLVRG